MQETTPIFVARVGDSRRSLRRASASRCSLNVKATACRATESKRVASLETTQIVPEVYGNPGYVTKELKPYESGNIPCSPYTISSIQERLNQKSGTCKPLELHNAVHDVPPRIYG